MKDNPPLAVLIRRQRSGAGHGCFRASRLDSVEPMVRATARVRSSRANRQDTPSRWTRQPRCLGREDRQRARRSTRPAHSLPQFRNPTARPPSLQASKPPSVPSVGWSWILQRPVTSASTTALYMLTHQRPVGYAGSPREVNWTPTGVANAHTTRLMGRRPPSDGLGPLGIALRPDSEARRPTSAAVSRRTACEGQPSHGPSCDAGPGMLESPPWRAGRCRWRGRIVWPSARAWRARSPKGDAGSNPALSALVHRGCRSAPRRFARHMA
jgi:hypothetical protein